MMIVVAGDKKIVSSLSPEDARLVLLALFSEDIDLPEMTPPANMAYASFIKGSLQLKAMPAAGKIKHAQENNQAAVIQTGAQATHSVEPGVQISMFDVNPLPISGGAGNHACEESNARLQALRFDRFWAAYPRKVGKEAARKAWRRITPTDEHMNIILLAIEKAKKGYQWQKDNGQFIPNPATWLNQGRWDDEIQPAGVRRQNGNIGNMGNFEQREYSSEYFEQIVATDFGTI